MLLSEVKGRAVHENGWMRVDRRPGISKAWEYQVQKLLDQDWGPEWCPADPEQIENWPEDGWESVDDW